MNTDIYVVVLPGVGTHFAVAMVTRSYVFIVNIDLRRK